MRFSEGLMVAHACLLVAFFVGATFLPPYDRAPEDSASQRMLRVLCTCALGFAAIGFVGLLLAFVGMLNLPAILVTLAACIVAGAYARKESPLVGGYWRRRLDALAGCWDAPLLSLYYLMLVLAFPDVNLVNLGSDPVAYHLAYAADWAASGHLVVDPFLRLPFYASNFVLLDSMVLLLHAQVFVIFLVWCMGLITALGVFAASRIALSSQGIGNAWSSCAGLFFTLAVVLAPAYFRWLTSAYIDVPIGAFALLTTLSVVVGVREYRREWLMAAAVTGGFLVGMKGSFLPFIVVFGVALWVAARHLRLKRGAILALLAVLIAVSSPWYLRNWIVAGDPISPVLNLAIYGRDGLTTQAEEQSVVQDLPSARSAGEIITLPFRAFWNADTIEFREYGTSALILTLYVLAVFVLVTLIRRRRVATDILIAIFVLVMFTGYWAVSTVLLRYSLLFWPLLAVCAAMVIGSTVSRLRWRGPLTAGFAALTMLPTPGSADYFHQTYLSQFRYLPQSYTSDSQLQSLFADGYKEETFVATLLRRDKAESEGVYVLGPPLDYYFRLDGVRSVGDWIGPAGYFRLYRAIDAGEAATFLGDLGVTAMLINPATIIGGLDVPLQRQLASHGFCAVGIPQSTYEFYVQCTIGTRSAHRRG